MKLVKVSGECGKDDCPAVYTTDRGSLVVQGALLTEDHDIAPAAGEALVEIPYSVLLEAAGAVGR